MRRAPEEALRIAVDVLGGDKAVGCKFKPEADPAIAGQWVAHCLDANRREKFSLAQAVWIFAQAKAAGDHRAFELFAELCGYRVTAAISEAEAVADIAKRARAAADLAHELSEECMERMRRAGLKL